MASCGIPQDLVVEILKRVPVQSLLRFKATSKGWYALISCPNFIKSHLASSPDRVLIIDPCRSREVLLFPDCDDESRAVNLDTRGDESVNLITDDVDPALDFSCEGIVSCDGIVCLYGSCEYDGLPDLTLWNPATKKFKSLPISMEKNGARYSFGGKRCWYVGFGFDSKTDDYKAVVIMNSWSVVERDCVIKSAAVFGLKTNSWRVIDAAVPPIFYTSTTQTYTQGMCYWIAHGEDIVSFDMEEEVIQVRPAPRPKLPSEPRTEIKLASWNESLVVMYYEEYYSPIDVWTTKKDLLTVGGNCWTLQYITEIPSGAAQFYSPCLHPLGFWKNCLLFVLRDDFLPVSVFGDLDKDFCLYNPVTGEIRIVQFPKKIYDDYETLMTSSYKETLVSLA